MIDQRNEDQKFCGFVLVTKQENSKISCFLLKEIIYREYTAYQLHYI